MRKGAKHPHAATRHRQRNKEGSKEQLEHESTFKSTGRALF